MAKKKNRKGKKRRKQNMSLTIIVLVLMLASGAIYFVLMHNIMEKNEQKEKELVELEEEQKTLQKELTKKQYELNYYQSDENIEKKAREELGLVMPQEIEFIISN